LMVRGCKTLLRSCKPLHMIEGCNRLLHEDARAADETQRQREGPK